MSYRIRVVGNVYGHGTPNDEVLAEIGDMLRYDSGDVESVEFEDARYGKKYTAIVHIDHYTKDRWDSFLLNTEVIEQVAGAAPPARFNTQGEVAQFTREKCR